jgi:Domain of unknown function (DUF4411)
MMVYCIDTSSLLAAWNERYPIENFPKFWGKIENLITGKRLVSPIEVLHETSKRSDELHKWLKERGGMFRDLDEEIQIAGANVLAKFPRLVGEKKLRTSADPWVIAVASVEGLKIVTEEKPTGRLDRPNIPDVCAAMNIETIPLLDLIRAEKWIVG